MTAADWDREPTSDAERARWQVSGADPRMVIDTAGRWIIGTFPTPELAACAAWDHNVMHAAREKRALGVGQDTTKGAK